jgi:hypothetical protein
LTAGPERLSPSVSDEGHWGLPGAEAVLRLRAVVSNGDLDPYWRYHTAREHERLYPVPGHRNFALTA